MHLFHSWEFVKARNCSMDSQGDLWTQRLYICFQCGTHKVRINSGVQIADELNKRLFNPPTPDGSK